MLAPPSSSFVLPRLSNESDQCLECIVTSYNLQTLLVPVLGNERWDVFFFLSLTVISAVVLVQVSQQL